MKQKAKDSNSKAMREKINENERLAAENKGLVKELHDLSESIHEYQNQLTFSKEDFDNEKHELELLQEAMEQENEDLKKQMQLRDKQSIETKNDLAHLSKIIQDMTQLNNELNEKVVDMNAQMEMLNSENFATKRKAENAEELEKTLYEQTEEHNNLLKL